MATNQTLGRDTPADLTPSLVVRLRAGDADAGAVLVEFYREAMMRFCWAYLGSAEQAEDAVQEIFYKVLKARSVPDRFRPWLYRIARNHCLNAVRDRARRRPARDLPADSRLRDSATGYLTRLVKNERRARVAHLLAAMPAEYREVLHLRYGEELSRAEIAEVLELPESVVKSRLYEGLKKLREHSSLLKGT